VRVLVTETLSEAGLERLRRDLVANVSHELKTPISAIRAHLENLMDGIEEPNPALLAVMVQQAERLSRLVDRPLDVRAFALQVLDFEPFEEFLDAFLAHLGLLECETGEKRSLFLRKVCDLPLKINRFRLRVRLAQARNDAPDPGIRQEVVVQAV